MNKKKRKEVINSLLLQTELRQKAKRKKKPTVTKYSYGKKTVKKNKTKKPIDKMTVVDASTAMMKHLRKFLGC